MKTRGTMIAVGAAVIFIIASGRPWAATQAGLVPVFSYRFPASADDLSTIETVRDLSPAGHHAAPCGFLGPGSCLTDIIPPGMPGGTKSVDFGTTTDQRLILTFDKRLLNTAEVAAGGGFAFDVWFYSLDGAWGSCQDILDYAATESLVLADGKLTVRWNGVIETDFYMSFSTNTWYHAVLRFDTQGNSAVPDDGYRGQYMVDGLLTLTVDGKVVASKALTKRGQGDLLNRRIGIGCYTYSEFEAQDFSGYIYDPTVHLGVVPEPSTSALLAAGLMGLLASAWRKRAYFSTCSNFTFSHGVDHAPKQS